MAKQEIKVIHFPPGEIVPLFVAARDVPKLIIGLSAKTLSNWRCQKIGPAYHMVNGVPYYEWQELKGYFSTGRVETGRRANTQSGNADQYPAIAGSQGQLGNRKHCHDHGQAFPVC